MKTTQNTEVNQIGLHNPNTETMLWRYFLATTYCKDKVVADAATGFGYGASILKALGAKVVVGYDIDKEALAYANERYSRDDLLYKELDVTKKTNIPLNSYDTVISIETFEHLPREKVNQYLTNLKKMVKEGGTVLITTPRRLVPEWKYDGGTHLYEYNPKEFHDEITAVFKESDCKFKGIAEQRAGPYQQLVSIFNDDINNSRVMVCLVENVTKKD
jgi:2-polyprenyl-3-methyl-5-hydroxy-6-metoxy-1,4-benzoquinol methylase